MTPSIRKPARLVATMLLALAAGGAQAGCARTLDDLRRLLGDPRFPLTWEETTMRDGRPLVVTLDEQPGGLWISFVKTGEGPWAEGLASLCGNADALEANLGPSLRVGPAAGWLLRQALQLAPVVRLRRTADGKLQIATAGWSGSFVPGAGRLGLKAP